LRSVSVCLSHISNKSSAVWPQQTWAEKWGICCGGATFPCNTVWPGPRPASVPSGILIHPAVWPQYINVTDRPGVTGQDGQRSDSIWRTVLQTVAQKYMSKLHKSICTYYLWPWLGPPRTTMQYVIYFQFVSDIAIFVLKRDVKTPTN